MILPVVANVAEVRGMAEMPLLRSHSNASG